MNENNKQDVSIAKIQKDVEYIKQALDKQIHNDEMKFTMLENKIIEKVGANKLLIDNHCLRIREIEKSIGTGNIQKEINDIRMGQNINKTKLGMLILTLSTFFTLIANYVLQEIKH